MKTIFQFSIIIVLFTFFDVKAQQDSTAKLPLMKSNSQIFIAEIKTNRATKKGVLYEADSNKIVILDSLLRRVEIPISEVKLLIIKRSNAVKFGFKTGFFIPLVPTVVIEFILLASGAGSSYWGPLLLVLNPLIGLGLGLIFGGILALASHYIPNTTVNLERWQDEYLNQLKYIKRKTQKVLTQKYSKQTRLI
jgi:hypothetical protein